MSSLLTFLLLFVSTLKASIALAATTPSNGFIGDLEKRSNGVTCSEFAPVCPDLNFFWHADNQNIMHYSLELTSVSWISDNTYEITIHVQGAESIDLKYLWSLKIIGVTGPEGSIQLYGTNEKTYLIDDPTDYTATFQVYGQPTASSCLVMMPNFQIQYEYLQGTSNQYTDTWTWGQSSFDLMTGCGADNNNNANSDFPDYYWSKQCGGCGSSSSSTSSSSSSSSSSKASSSSSSSSSSISSSSSKPSSSSSSSSSAISSSSSKPSSSSISSSSSKPSSSSSSSSSSRPSSSSISSSSSKPSSSSISSSSSKPSSSSISSSSSKPSSSSISASSSTPSSSFSSTSKSRSSSGGSSSSKTSLSSSNRNSKSTSTLTSSITGSNSTKKIPISTYTKSSRPLPITSMSNTSLKSSSAGPAIQKTLSSTTITTIENGLTTVYTTTCPGTVGSGVTSLTTTVTTVINGVTVVYTTTCPDIVHPAVPTSISTVAAAINGKSTLYITTSATTTTGSYFSSLSNGLVATYTTTVPTEVSSHAPLSSFEGMANSLGTGLSGLILALPLILL